MYANITRATKKYKKFFRRWGIPMDSPSGVLVFPHRGLRPKIQKESSNELNSLIL